MHYRNNAVLQRPRIDNPLQLIETVGGHPNIDFSWREIGGKRRLIGNPNKPMRKLHGLFSEYLRAGIRAMGDADNYTLRKLHSSTAFVKGSNPLKNAQKHCEGKFFYIVDIRNAYPSVDLVRLTVLIVYVVKYSKYSADFSLSRLGQNALLVDELCGDPLFTSVHAFLESFCAGLHGIGLAVGGPLSPYLFNLYSEVFMDASLRRLCQKHDIAFTRYADDCVFSRGKPITKEMRRDIRTCITRAGFVINHRKSKVLCRAMGTVFVTKVGLQAPSEDGSSCTAKLVFSQKKRRRLHGIIKSYLAMQMDWPEKVSGYVAEFVYYYKNVGEPTATDRKTFALCKEFEAEWSRHP